MHKRHRLDRIEAWLRRQSRWISSADLHLWQAANLGSSRSKRSHDLRTLVDEGRVVRRRSEGRFEYHIVPSSAPAVVPPHVLACQRIERALAQAVAHVA